MESRVVQRVIITGPTGSIGIALINYLISKGVEVLAICRPNSKRINSIPKHELVHVMELSLENITRLPKLVSKTYDVFYHFGWDGTFGNSRNNVYGQLSNIKYTLDAVETSSALGCHTFVGAGSQAEYGRTDGMLKPDTPAFPENGYGIAKLTAGNMSRLRCEQLGIAHIWTRILSVYGPFDGENTLVSSVIRKLLSNEHIATTLGEQQWDYLYSKDAANAMFLIGKKGISGKTYIIGSGNCKSLRTYIEQIANNISPNAQIGYGEIPYSQKQVMYLQADISELTIDTGFLPKYTFESGIEETIEWWKNRG